MKIHNYLWLLLMGMPFYTYAQTGCVESRANRILYGNEVYAIFRAGGDMFWDGTSQPFFMVPFDSTQSNPLNNPSTMFAGALWLGAYDAGGDLKLAAQTYRSNGNDYWTGPLDSSGQAARFTCENFDYIWQVKRWQVEAHVVDYNDNGVLDNPVDSALLKWPGQGNPHFAAAMGFALPNQALAPFYDRNGNGLYEPLQGDYPVYEDGVSTAVAEDLLWWVFNDNGNLHTQTNGQPLKAEIQASAWSFECPNDSLLNRTIFVRHKIINKSGETWYDFKAGLWSDSDLGCSNDDYVGTDTATQTVYFYNQDNYDDSPCGFSGALGYGLNPPVQTITLLNQPLSSSIYHINSSSDPKGDPSSPIGFYRLLSGVWPNGTLLTAGGDGYNPSGSSPTDFAFPTNPNTSGGWSMYSANLSGLDQRTVSTTERDSEAFVLDVAYAYHREAGRNNLTNVNLALQQVPQIQALYDSSFADAYCGRSLNLVHKDSDEQAPVLYPNPTQQYTTLTMTLEEPQTLQIRLLNSMGQVVYEQIAQDVPAGEYQHQIPTTQLPTGIYHCHLIATQQQHVLSLVKGR